MLHTIALHSGSLLLGLIFAVFGGLMMAEIAFVGCNGAWMARRKMFARSACGFFAFYLLLHILMFTWG